MKIPEDVGMQKQLTELHIQEWLKYDLLHPRWWILIALICLFIILWCILVNKARLLEVSLYVLLAGVLFLGINEYGEELALWDYPTDVIPIFPPMSSINMIMLPLLFSLIYQYFESRKSFIIASLVTTCAMCFIVEPILSICGFYQLVHWKYFESVPVYFMAAMTIRAAVIIIIKYLKNIN